ncbi:Sodium-coupled monocarboxylate transporter 1 [Acropora cervicornis]|uniref:Sodium-coupled monocarboxylate transporter 1 n=1 Tax=Acropora cervicornis TaxID=6130 RepID=A0AAD9VCM0_ACRCE|nr:Sodium-coupled monocarboxylate transporter 1 [Acropora cervicornis]
MAGDRFSVVDYVVFSVMLLISAFIGVWHACRGGKQNTTEEYLLANRKMKFLPVSISILLSFLSAITLLGIPAEIYVYGAQFFITTIAYLLICIVVSTVFIPMFRRIKLTSVHEYLERRFSLGIRILTSCLFILTAGGLKAVVWTDVFQAIVMVAGLIAVAISGTMQIGGVKKVWEINDNYGRLNFFDFNPDPRIRNTFWSLTIGLAMTLLPLWGLAQYFVQRYLAIKTLKDAKRAIWVNVPFLFIVIAITVFDGMVIFAMYAGCDLLTTRKIARGDQVLPYFVIDKLGHLTGLPGTISSAINALAMIILEDIVKKKIKLTDSEATKVSKFIAVLFGVITMGGAFGVKYAGAMVLQLAYSISGLTGGILLALFLLAGSIMYPPNRYPGIRSVRECPFYQDALAANSSIINGTSVHNNNETTSVFAKYGDGIIRSSFKPYTSVPLADFYSLSYLWVSTVGFIVAVVFGLIGSFVLESKEDRQRYLDPKLLFPLKAWLQGFLPGHQFSWEEEDSKCSYYLEDAWKDENPSEKASTPTSSMLLQSQTEF